MFSIPLFSQIVQLLMVTFLAISAIWYLVFFLYLKPFVCNVPGPVPLPLIGNWLNMLIPGRLSLAPVTRTPIVCYWLGTLGMKPYVYVCDREIVREIATTRKDVFLNRGGRDLIAFMCADSKESILTSRGAFWVNQRKILGNWLASAQFTDDFFKAHRDSGENLVSQIDSDARRDPGFVAVSELVYEHMAKTGSKIMFGFSRHPASRCPDSKNQHSCQRTDSSISYWTRVCVLPLIPTDWWKRILGAPLLKHLTGYARHDSSHLDQRRITTQQLQNKKNPRPETLKRLVGLARNEISQGLTIDRSTRRLIANIIGLAHGSSKNQAAIVSYALFQLARHPDKQARLRRDIQKNFASRLPESASDLDCIPYLDAVVNEAIRMRPAFPVVAKLPEKRTTLAGYRIPIQAEIAINIGGIHYDPRYWESPDVFRPERFMNNKNRNFVFIPFGVGRRICPGQRAGKISMKIVLFALLHQFEFELPHRDYQRVESSSVTISLKQPMYLKVRRKSC